MSLTGDTGPINIFAHSRPHYLQRCLDSIKQQTVKPWSVTVWVDGVENKFSGRRTCRPEDHEKVIEVAENHPVVTDLQVMDENLGVAIMQFEVYEDLCHRRDLHRFHTFLDDDVVLGPDYLRLTELLIPWLIEDDTLFSATPAFRRTVALDRIPFHLDTVEYGEFNWIGYVMDLGKWDTVREHFKPYMKLVEGVDYAMRPHEAIRKLTHGNGWMKPHTSQDCGKDMALHLAGMRRLRCSVNRGFYIGEEGVHGTKTLYQAQGWHEHTPYHFPTDANLKRLRLFEDGGYTSPALRAHYTWKRRVMNATEFFHGVVKRYVEPRAHDRCLQEIKAAWPKVERDAAGVGKDVTNSQAELQAENGELKTLVGQQEETIRSLTQQLEDALNPPPKPAVAPGFHDPRTDPQEYVPD